MALRVAFATVGSVALAGATLLSTERSFAQATAAVAATTANLNQRAGPGTQYPSLQVVPAGAQVTLYGCIGGVTWCEGSYRGTRGWLSASYLQVWQQNQYTPVAQFVGPAGFPTVAFDLETYWGRHYANQPFYPDRQRWISVSASAGVQIGAFYDRLSPHGRWVWLNGRYVWVPAVNANWRPYTEGHWRYTRRYGWIWVSNEPFGWATYHYGRWGYSHRFGWFWVPGTRWAPAWVSWRRSGDHIAWAPLPPDPGDSFSFNVSYGTIPDYYWQPVPARLFLSINLSINIIRDEREKAAVLAETQEAGAVTEAADAIVNEAIDVGFVEEVTQETVTPVEVALTTDPDQAGATEGETLEIFHPPPEEPVASEPAEVTPIEVVEAESETAGQAPPDEADTEELVPPPPAPDETPPPSETPPITDDATAAPATTEPAAPEEIVCPEGTTLENGECLPQTELPPPPITEEPVIEEAPAPTVEEPSEPPPPASSAEEPPAADEAPPAAEESPPPPPAAEEPPPPPPAAEEPPPPPPAAEEEPAPPPPPAEEPPPPADEPPPPPPPAEEPPPQPAEEPPPPPAAEEPPAQVEPPPPCPEGYVLLPDGTCGVAEQ